MATRDGDIPITTWEQVDQLVRFVARNRPGTWWCYEVQWRPEGGYQVKFVKGPGMAWYTTRVAYPPPGQLLAQLDTVDTTAHGEGGE